MLRVMNFHMNLKSNSVWKQHLAVFALILEHLSLVSLGMLVQISFLGEFLIALFTEKRLLPRMDSEMIKQIPLFGEGLLAPLKGALEELFIFTLRLVFKLVFFVMNALGIHT